MVAISMLPPATLDWQRRLVRLVSLALDSFRIGEQVVWPFLDLFVRLWLAQTFWVSGIVKIADWQTALYLAAHEYPVPWLDPVSAAYLGVAIELLGPVFLVLGLGTRFAAAALLGLTLTIQLAYLAVPEQAFWAILFGWYGVMGAGPISLDRPLSRGLRGSALPFASITIAAFARVTRYLGPVYLLFIRYSMATLFFFSALTKLDDFAATLFLFEFEYRVPLLPPAFAATLATLVELSCPVLLVIGLGSRLAAAALIAMTAVIQFTYLSHVEHLYWALLLGIVLLRGPGPLSVDAYLLRWVRQLIPQLQKVAADVRRDLPHVVIVGAGFGGVAAARGLRNAPCRVTLIDRHNYFLFQPLLYQVATAELSPSEIAVPIRSLFRDQDNARVLLGEVTGVDPERQVVAMGASRVAYDYLVLATGARHSYFGRDEWAPHAPGLKQIDDATEVRRRLLLAFERAETSADPEEQRAFLTFAIVGAGPTGVELAGAIAELARHGLAREFRSIDPAAARVLLVHSGPRVLPTFPAELSHKAQRSLIELGVEVMTDSRVEQVDAHGITVNGAHIAARTVFWAAGVAASPVAKWLTGEADRSGRLKVAPDLSVPGVPNVFVIGDAAWSSAWNGQTVPGLAPAAKQGGKYVAKIIRGRLEARHSAEPFRYRHAGSLATIGRRAAVADFGRVRLSGSPAWWLWGIVHIAFLSGMRNRLAVMIDWFWAYLTFRRSTRLITGEQT